MRIRCLLLAVTWSIQSSKSMLAEDAPLYTPQPEHALLQRFAGEWRFEKMSVPEAGQTAEKLGSGKIQAEMLGAMFVVCRWSGNVYGTNYTAVQTLGYDVQKKRYSGCWVDSIMNYRWEFAGLLATDPTELVVTATGPSPDGENTQFRERYQFHSAASMTIVAEMLKNEQWIPFMMTSLTRREGFKND